MGETLRSVGRPLDPGVRSRMEEHFAYDFGKVRVHTDARAAASAQAIGAVAYTVGRNVVFGAGQYRPGTRGGEHVLAHELAHVMQQRHMAGTVQHAATAPAADDSLEREAHAAADTVVRGGWPKVVGRATATGVQRMSIGGPYLTLDAAGGCGICYRGDVRAIGRDVHRQIQELMVRMYEPFMFPEVRMAFDRRKWPYIINAGIPDLVRSTPWSTQVGEIKPANPEGFFEGAAKMQIYLRLFREYFRRRPGTPVGFRVEPLDAAPPRPFPFKETKSPTCRQMVVVNPPVEGVYTYLCVPPFSVARRVCRCRDEKRGRRRAPEKAPQRKRRGDKRERAAVPDVTAPSGVPAPATKDAPTPAPAAVGATGPSPEDAAKGTALLAALGLAAALLRKAAGKAAGRRVAAPAVVLAAAVLVADGAEAHVGLSGDDILDTLCARAAQKGTPVPDDVKQAIRNDPALRKIMDNMARTGDVTEAQRRLGEQLTRTVAENRGEFSDDDLRDLLRVSEAHRGVVPGAAATADDLKRSLTQRHVERLMGELATRVGRGAPLSAAQLTELRALLTAQQPPLTEAEIQDLITRVRPATKGEGAAELVASVRKALEALRGKPGGDTAGSAVPPARWASLSPGTHMIFGPKDLVLRDGMTFTATLIGQDEKTGQRYHGSGTVRARATGNGWDIEVPAGIPLYSPDGRLLGTTVKKTWPGAPRRSLR
ncbi:eCIS core domain-containing protein [Streptomyces telluris]|uniref:DUF4157 domain-containing protein n=3 Tax=Streptomyces telluris TaxID=2720021 RepID=A0A9X2RN44_9ACTN|nr:DUF4157 domain-containing protein [Streptomyces telluris]MCQ8771569.1 DUF4157 domain-containing protein [Streptomyces telluris]